jgi:hypothetical protein
VITVGKIVHSLELLVDNTDASFVSAVGDLLDIFGRLSEFGKLLVDNLGRLNGSLRMELRWKSKSVFVPPE